MALGVPTEPPTRTEIWFLRIGLDAGFALRAVVEDIQHNYSDEPLSRRIAERLRDTVRARVPTAPTP
jgi:hypothetical protein